jgi:hypothetical protein
MNMVSNLEKHVGEMTQGTQWGNQKSVHGSWTSQAAKPSEGLMIHGKFAPFCCHSGNVL